MAIEELDIDGLDMDGNSASDIMADTTQGDQRDMIEHLRSLKESLVLGQATAHNPGKMRSHRL